MDGSGRVRETTETEFDVIVVGARVGGATTAALLGDLGHRVLLLDRGTFPSPTISTHFFRGAHFVAVLRRLGLPEAAEFSVLEDEVAYMFPSDAGLCCIAVSVNACRFDWLRTSLEDRFTERIRARSGLRARFDAAVIEGRALGSGPEPNVVRVPAGRGRALVGDAGLHQDPWTGRGMAWPGSMPPSSPNRSMVGSEERKWRPTRWQNTTAAGTITPGQLPEDRDFRP